MSEKRRKIEKRIARIDPASGEAGSTDDEIDDRDREVLLEFYEEIKRINVKESRFAEDRILTLLDTMLLTSKHVDVPLRQTLVDGDDGQDAVDAVTDWMDEHYGKNSLDTRFSCVKIFGELMTPGDEQPERFDEITLNNGPADPTPQASNLLRWEEEVLTIIQYQDNERDEAIVATCWSTGGRPDSELHKLTIGDVEIKDGYVLISIPEETKTGSREVKMHTGAPFLIRWVKNLPC